MLIQLCYASRRVEREHDLVRDLSDILEKSSAFNHIHDIHGVLYYAEGIYFQCLEGEQTAVEALFQTITQDLRHHQIHRFADRRIEHFQFKKWSMKYVNQHGKISRLFKAIGLEKFQPHQLHAEQMSKFLRLLLKMEEARHEVQPRTGLTKRGYQNYF